MHAVVLAAGEGQRLRPLTRNRPKPMLPVGNRPVLEHVLEAIATAGIEDVVLVVGYRRDRIQNHFGDGDDWGLSITYAEQEQQLGTGHALLQAEPHVDGTFVTVNGDRIIDPQAIEMVCDRVEETNDAAIAITEVETPSNYGVVSLEDGLITRIQEHPTPGVTESNLINAGVYCFDASIFEAIRDTESRGELGITDTINDLIDDHPVLAVPYGGRWLDISYPWDLIHVNDRVLGETHIEHADSATINDTATVVETSVLGADTRVRANATVLGGCAVGENVEVGANTVLKNSIVLSDTTINPGSILTDCIVGANTTIGPGTVVEGGSTSVQVDGSLHEDVRFGGLLGDNTQVGGNVTVRPGTILGNDVSVQGGAVVSGQIDSGTVISRG